LPSTAQHAPDGFDLIIIGGGVNGTGVARDAAMRGLRVMLLEKRDFACGSSGANSGMIHGGFRYMLEDTEVTRLSSIDSGYIQRIAPHLLFRVAFIYPISWRHGRPERKLGQRIYDYATEVFFSAYDKYQPFKGGKGYTRLSAEEALSIEPGLSTHMHGALTMDEYGIDPFRVCALNVRSAAAYGAVIRNYAQVVDFVRGPGGDVLGVRFRDLHSGVVDEVRAKLVFNAGGPWAPRVAKLAGLEVKMRPGKGVHLTLDRRLSNFGVITNGIDGRQFFMIPHESSTIIGTTDDDYYGDPDDIPITQDEIEYLLQGIEHVFPKVREARVLRAWAGVRNTAYEWGTTEDDLSREHIVIDHARDGAANLLTFVGGKLASFRAQAQDVTDQICARLGRGGPCRTHIEPLPGGESTPDAGDLARAFDAPAYSVARMVYRYGAEAAKILELTKEDPTLAAPVCPCEGTTGAELVFSIRTERAEHLVDLRRRCRLGMGSCQGARCIQPAAALLAREKKLSARETQGEMLSFLSERWRGNRAVASGTGLAQAELTMGTFFTVGHLPADAPIGPARR
jgi:glycerol-3-phosphate dehydrogenase